MTFAATRRRITCRIGQAAPISNVLKRLFLLFAPAGASWKRQAWLLMGLLARREAETPANAIASSSAQNQYVNGCRPSSIS